MAKYICSICRSDEVSSKCRANPNTDEVYDYVSSEEEDNWCDRCQNHVFLVLEGHCPVDDEPLKYRMLNEGSNLVEYGVCNRCEYKELANYVVE